jgi:hypothetical protein
VARAVVAVTDPKALTWERISEYCVHAGTWYVSRVCVKGDWTAELWREHRYRKYGKRIRCFATSGDAIEYAKAIVARATRHRSKGIAA